MLFARNLDSDSVGYGKCMTDQITEDGKSTKRALNLRATWPLPNYYLAFTGCSEENCNRNVQSSPKAKIVCCQLRDGCGSSNREGV